MSKYGVAVLFDMLEQYKKEFDILTESRCDLFYPKNPDELARIIDGIDVLIGPVPASDALFKNAFRLKWMQSHSAGVENYIEIFRRMPGAVLTNASGAYGQGISEYMIAYLLVIYKKILQYAKSQQKHEWNDYGKVRTIEGSSVTVIGLGNLGGTFAKKMHALGAVVRGVKQFPAPKPDYLEKQYTTENIDEALDGADVVALCLPSTPRTKGLLTRERIFSLKKDAVVLNVGRGSAVDQEALCDALREKRIYAGLDVTVPEPLPPTHELWDFDNLYMTPHISGGPSSAYAPQFISSLIVRNMRAFLDGRPLENVVDLELGY